MTRTIFFPALKIWWESRERYKNFYIESINRNNSLKARYSNVYKQYEEVIIRNYLRSPQGKILEGGFITEINSVTIFKCKLTSINFINRKYIS